MQKLRVFFFPIFPRPCSEDLVIKDAPAAANGMQVPELWRVASLGVEKDRKIISN